MNQSNSDTVLKFQTALGAVVVGPLLVITSIGLMFVAGARQAPFIGGGVLGAAFGLCLVLLSLWLRGTPRETLIWGLYYLVLPLNIGMPLSMPFDSVDRPLLCYSAAGGILLVGLWYAIGLRVGDALVRRLNRGTD